MRKSIFEILNNRGNINLKKEIESIEKYLDDIYIYRINNLSSFIDENIVKDWKYSNRCLSIDDLREKLKITSTDLEEHEYDLEHSLSYIELMYNLIMEAHMKVLRFGLEYEDSEEFKRLIKHIKSLLEELNYEIVKVEDRHEIIEKDSKATYVAESNTEIATDIIEYRKYDLKGDLKAKKDILLRLSPQVEALKKDFDQTTYKSLMDDTQYLLNNFHIRHNNKRGQYKIEEICKMKDKELEEWYDTTYNNILSVFIIKDYLKNKSNIDAIKKIVKK